MTKFPLFRTIFAVRLTEFGHISVIKTLFITISVIFRRVFGIDSIARWLVAGIKNTKYYFLVYGGDRPLLGADTAVRSVEAASADPAPPFDDRRISSDYGQCGRAARPSQLPIKVCPIGESGAPAATPGEPVLALVCGRGDGRK